MNDFCPNNLSPSIQQQILQTDLHIFPSIISWENLIKDQSIFSLVIILLILITLYLDNVWICFGENWRWSPLGLTGLNRSGPEGFGGTLLPLPFVPPPPGLLRQIPKQIVFFFLTLNSAFRTLQDMLLTCRVFSSSQKAIKRIVKQHLSP